MAMINIMYLVRYWELEAKIGTPRLFCQGWLGQATWVLSVNEKWLGSSSIPAEIMVVGETQPVWCGEGVWIPDNKFYGMQMSGFQGQG